MGWTRYSITKLTNTMETINSLSGGKTSSYMAIHYPSDYNIFALVCNEDINCSPKDRSLIQKVNDKFDKYGFIQYGEFEGTTEDPSIIKTMLDLEQKLGSEVIWVRGDSFEKMCEIKKAIPNQQKRFCTTELKIKPIFEFWKTRIGEKVKMNIGFRYDEDNRVNSKIGKPDIFEYTYKSQLSKTGNWYKKWIKEDNWRDLAFPLFEDEINVWHVKKFWQGNDIIFSSDSNCQMCFWKSVQQLRRNVESNPDVIDWAIGLENKIGRTFKETPMMSIKKIGLQTSFSFGSGSGCNAGFCTD